jgi:single-stranded DNA-specific DHH superfamily exonuclease
MHNMRKAARADRRAIKAGEKIVVYGDYDVDGMTGTSTLMLAIKMLGGTVDFYVPHRVTEGYGLHEDSIKADHRRRGQTHRERGLRSDRVKTGLDRKRDGR